MASPQSFGVMDRQLNDRERWLCFTALFLFSFVAAFNLFKAAPALQFIGEDFGMQPASIGYIMSAYSIAVVVLAFPGMVIMQKLGVKASILGASIIMLIGTLAGTVSQGSVLFMASRIVEGAAYGAMHVMCPNVMPRLFPRNKQGLVMGIFSQCVPVGTIISFFAAPALFEFAGWRAIWTASIVLEIIAIVFVLLFVKMPKVNENELVEGGSGATKVPFKNFMAMAMVVAIVFFAWTYCYVGNINSLYPTFLQNEKGLSVFDSSMLPNVTAIISIPAGIFLGAFAQKRQCSKLLTAGSYIIFAVILFFLAFTDGPDMIGPWVFACILGVLGGIIPSTTRILIPLLAPDLKKTDLGLTTMSMFAGLGQCVGSVVAAGLVAQAGWQVNAHLVLAPMALAAGILILIFVKSDKKIAEYREQEKAQAAN